MLEHLRAKPLVPLQPEDVVTSPKPVEDQPRAVEVSVVASPSNCPSPQKFGKSPRGKFLLTRRKGVGFSLGIAQETSTVQTELEGTSLGPIPTEEPPIAAGAELESGLDQEDPDIPFPVGAKIRPMTRSANKQGLPTETPASTKRPTKTPRKGSSSKKPKR